MGETMERHETSTTKIAVMVTAFDLTGVPLAQLRLAGALVARGFDVDLVIGSVDAGVTIEVPAGVRLHLLGSGQVRRLIVPIARYLRRVRPDVVFSAQDHLNVVVALAATMARSRARITASSRITPVDAYAGRPFSKGWLLKQVIRLAWRRIDVLTCVSQGMVEEYRQMFPGARHVCVYNIVDEATLAGRETANGQADAGLPAIDRRRMLVSAGYLALWKGYDVLLRAIALVPREADVHLVVLGDGPQRAALTALAGTLGVTDRVTFAGYVTNPVRFYRAAATFVHAARRESFGNVLVEAMLCGCTVVATDCPTGPGEILDRGRFGYLVPTDDPAALARGIVAALADPVAPDRLRDATRRFRAGPVVERHLALLGYAGDGDASA